MAFSDFQYGFRSSQLTADLLTVVSDRIVILGLLKLYVAHDTSKAFGRAWHAGLSHKLRSYRSSGQIFGLISSFPSNKQIQVVLDRKSSQEHPVNTVNGVHQGSIFGPFLSSYYILMTFLVLLTVILLSMLILLPTPSVIRHLICGNN